MTIQKKIPLPHGAITWISNHSGYGRDYVTEYTTDPENFKGSPTAAAKILKSIEAFQRYHEKLMTDNSAKLNAILSTSPHE